MKKILSLVLAVIMMMTLTAVGFAADMQGEAGVIGEFTQPDKATAQDNSVTLYKELKAYNPAASDVNGPTITYTYTVTPGSANKDIYDVKTAHTPQANAHVLTKAGITAGMKVNNGTDGTDSSATGTVAITPTTKVLKTASDGKLNRFPIVINFSGVDWTGAGVYRYQIEETVASYTSSGVVEGTTGHYRYLDVYVKDKATGTYEIYGYVCFTNNNNIDAQDTPTASTPNTVTAAAKTEGFVETTTGGSDGATSVTADQYYTYNVTISKELVNDQAMNNNQFPFSVAFANTTVTANVLPIVSGNGTRTQPSWETAAAITEFAPNGKTGASGNQIKIANGGSVTFTGIPAGTTVTIDEYNNVTGTTYTTTTSGGTTNEEDGINLTWDSWASAITGWNTVTALKATANENTLADADVTVTFSNRLLQISPTGYVSRIAPYVLILGAGIILLVLGFKRRTKKEEA